MSETQTIKIELPQQSYDIVIGAGGVTNLGPLMQPLQVGKKVLIVSNPVVFGHYGNLVITSLQSAGYEVSQCILPDGEQYKHLTSIQTIYDAALGCRLERSSTLVALGGGVIGDMTGFAAATWLRGINFVQVPTTLLAMVDASIGGKTGVNHPQGKNLIGAFYQPRLVVIDPQTLTTLPVREFRAGMAEVIKYGVIWHSQLFTELEQSEGLDQLSALVPGLLEKILYCSCQSKAEVVSQDEKESGIRAILNYGHTIGHAVESLTHYQGVIHGEAVAIGMVAASRLALAMGGCGGWDESCDRRQLALIRKAGLPTQVPEGVEREEILASLQMDKKVKDGKVRFILPARIGQAEITDQVTTEIIRQVLQSL